MKNKEKIKNNTKIPKKKIRKTNKNNKHRIIDLFSNKNILHV